MTYHDSLRKFRARLADNRRSDHFFEDRDGTSRKWPPLSSPGKLAHIAADALRSGVSAAQFRKAARELLPDAGDAALRLVLEQARELHELDRLLPDNNPAPIPLAERIRWLLTEPTESAGPPPERDRDREP